MTPISPIAPIPGKARSAAAPATVCTPQASGGPDAPERFAVFSDVHANLPALLAVLADMTSEGYPVRYCCGDLVGYGAHPNECIDLVMGAGVPTVLGNHDQMALTLKNLEVFNEAAQQAITWTAQTLAPEPRARLTTLPLVRRAGGCTFVHGSPYEPDQWHYILTRSTAQLNFGFFDGWICFIGHSHQPFVVTQAPASLDDTMPPWAATGSGSAGQPKPWAATGNGAAGQPTPGAAPPGDGGAGRPTPPYSKQDLYAGPRLSSAEPGGIPLDPSRRYIVNVGSVGQPRDEDPRACYVTVDLAAMRLRFHRVAYPVLEAQRAIVEAGLPRGLARRLARGR